jgi:hypothetical protein
MEQMVQCQKKFENIFARAKRLVQQISMAGAGVIAFFICYEP